jgi:hypothetical protein
VNFRIFYFPLKRHYQASLISVNLERNSARQQVPRQIVEALGPKAVAAQRRGRRGAAGLIEPELVAGLKQNIFFWRFFP